MGNWYDDVGLASLLAPARRVYGRAIRESLVAAGFDDMPRNGARVVAGLANGGGREVGGLAGDLGVSKQAASQLVDVLVSRGYVDRAPQELDRRRVDVVITSRGRAAATEVRDAVDAVDALLAATVSADDLSRTRAVLAALITAGADPAAGDPSAR